MTRFLVTITRRGHTKVVPYRGHRVQSATIGVAALNPGWLVVNVVHMPAGGCHAGLKPPAARWTRHFSKITSPIPAAVHDLPVRLIPGHTETHRIRADLDRRQQLRIEAGLPRLDVEAEFRSALRRHAEAAEREQLRPHLDAALSASEPSGGMYRTMVRHRDAHRAAKQARKPLGAEPSSARDPDRGCQEARKPIPD